MIFLPWFLFAFRHIWKKYCQRTTTNNKQTVNVCVGDLRLRPSFKYKYQKFVLRESAYIYDVNLKLLCRMCIQINENVLRSVVYIDVQSPCFFSLNINFKRYIHMRLRDFLLTKKKTHMHILEQPLLFTGVYTYAVRGSWNERE